MTWLWTWKLILFPFKIVQGEIKGLDNIPEEPYIILGNHNGHMDGPVLLRVCLKNKKIHFLAKRLWYSFLYIKLFECITKGDAVKKSIKWLKQGENIAIMPEGRINRKNTISNYKTGAASIALLTGVKILPVGIRGFPVQVNIGKPFSYKKISGQIKLEKRKKVMNEIMSKIAKLSSKKIKWI